MKIKKFQADRVRSYFRIEWKVLLVVTISGLIYNLGLLAGQMTGCLVNILQGSDHFTDMLILVTSYVVAMPWYRYPGMSSVFM